MNLEDFDAKMEAALERGDLEELESLLEIAECEVEKGTTE